MFRVAKIIILGLLFSSAAFADDDDYRSRGRDYRPALRYTPAQPRYIAPRHYGAGYPRHMSHGNHGYSHFQRYHPYHGHREYREREYRREHRDYGWYR